MMKGPKIRVKVYGADGKKAFDDEVDFTGVMNDEAAKAIAAELIRAARERGHLPRSAGEGGSHGREAHQPSETSACL